MLIWFGHVQRMVKSVMWIHVEGNKRRGRPKKKRNERVISSED